MKNTIEKIDLTCPRCHGTMEMNKEKNELNCPFCRHKIVLDEEENIEENIEELINRERKLSYARMDGLNLANEKAEKRKRKKRFFGKLLKRIIRLTILAIVVYAVYKWVYISRPFINDPFESIKYEFYGTDGDGQIELVVDSKIKNSINFEVSKTTKLYNDEIITIRANSIEYRLGNKEKQIKVEGLNKKLTSFNQLTKQIKDYINNKSMEYQKEMIKRGYSFKGKIASIKNYKMYLHTDGKNKSILYDVDIAQIKAPSGKKYKKILLTEYQDIIIINRNNDLIRFKQIDNKGDLVYAAGKTENDYCRTYYSF